MSTANIVVDADGCDSAGTWQESGQSGIIYVSEQGTYDEFGGFSFLLPAIAAGSTINHMYFRVHTAGSDASGTTTMVLRTEDVDPATQTAWGSSHLPRNGSWINTDMTPLDITAAPYDDWKFGSGDNQETDIASDLQDLVDSYGAISANDRINIAIVPGVTGGDYRGFDDNSAGTDDAELYIDWTEGGGGGATLTLADLSHTQSLDTTTLTQKHNLTVADLQQTQSLDAVSLTQAHNLAVAALLHSHSLDTTALTQKHSLVIDELFHTQTLDATALTQKHSLILADLLHAHSLDGGLALTSGGAALLVIADLLHSHALDATALSQKHQLVVADAAHTQSLDTLTLSQKHQLVVAELLHSHGLDSLELSFATSLVVDDLTHSHSIDGVDLVQAHVLQVDSLGQTHRLDDVSLSQKHLLALQDLLHTHNLDRVNFDIATGVVTIAFSAKTATVTFTSRSPGVTIDSKAPSVSWESNG